MKPDRDILISKTLLLPVQQAPAAPSFWAGLYQRYHFYRRQQQTRRQLRCLSEAQLNDIGIAREQAEVEAKKFFWQS